MGTWAKHHTIATDQINVVLIQLIRAQRNTLFYFTLCVEQHPSLLHVYVVILDLRKQWGNVKHRHRPKILIHRQVLEYVFLLRRMCGRQLIEYENSPQNTKIYFPIVYAFLFLISFAVAVSIAADIDNAVMFLCWCLCSFVCEPLWCWVGGGSVAKSAPTYSDGIETNSIFESN